VVDFDQLCVSPKSEIQKIVSFLEIKPDAENLAALCRIPHRPKSLGRYRAHDLSQFDPADLKELNDLGFSTTAECS
jgi:hypothetical protein